MVHSVNDALLVSTVTDTDRPEVWSDGMRNKYDPASLQLDVKSRVLHETHCGSEFWEYDSSKSVTFVEPCTSTNICHHQIKPVQCVENQWLKLTLTLNSRMWL